MVWTETVGLRHSFFPLPLFIPRDLRTIQFVWRGKNLQLPYLLWKLIKYWGHFQQQLKKQYASEEDYGNWLNVEGKFAQGFKNLRKI